MQVPVDALRLVPEHATLTRQLITGTSLWAHRRKRMRFDGKHVEDTTVAWQERSLNRGRFMKHAFNLLTRLLSLVLASVQLLQMSVHQE